MGLRLGALVTVACVPLCPRSPRLHSRHVGCSRLGIAAPGGRGVRHTNRARQTMNCAGDFASAEARAPLRAHAMLRGVLFTLACLALIFGSAFASASPASISPTSRSTATPAPLSSVLPAFGDHLVSASIARLHAENRFLPGGGSVANTAGPARLAGIGTFNELTALREPRLRSARWRSLPPRGPPQAARFAPV
jgi:hypothetical protein